MSREEFINIYCRSKYNILAVEDIIVVITNYLEEVSPEEYHKYIQQFLEAILGHPSVPAYYHYALNYYSRKFNITEMWSVPNERGDRHFITAY